MDIFYRITFLFFFVPSLFLPVISNGIESNVSTIDSLRQIVNDQSGTEKISAQLDLALELYDVTNGEAQELAATALKAAQALNDSQLKMRAFFVLGRIGQQVQNAILYQSYYDSALYLSGLLDDKGFMSEILLQKGIGQHIQGKYLEALQTLNNCIQIGRAAGKYRIVGGAYSMMGTIYRENGSYDMAIENIIKSRLNYEKAGFNEGYAWAAYLLGRIYGDLKLYEPAIEYFEEALKDYLLMAAIDQNKSGVAICYEQLAILHNELGEHAEASRNNENAQAIYRENNSIYGISNTDVIQGRIYYSAQKYDAAETFLLKALSEKKQLDDLLNQPRIYEYLGLCQIKLGRTEEGLDNLKKGLEVAITTNQKKNQLDIYAKLVDTYFTLNKQDSVSHFQNKYIDIQNELLSGGARFKIDQLQEIYELNAKNSQIEELERQNEINSLKIRQHRSTNLIFGVLIFMAVIISLITFGFYRNTRKKKQQLAEANAAKDKFFAIIAHDLRGPTRTLSSFLGHLHSEFDELQPDKLKEIIQLLYKSSENVSELLENLLVWAQAQTNNLQYTPQVLVLSEVVSESCRSLETLARKKQIEVSFEPDIVLNVWADLNMLQTIFRNIIGNAIKFTGQGGKILIATTKDNTHAIVRFADNGTGIEPEGLATLFDIDNHYFKPGTEGEKSTGLGLILVKDFVEKNKGEIKIESQVGVGTTVSISLPLALS